METSEKTRVMDALHNLASGNVLLEELEVIADITVSNGDKKEKLFFKLHPMLTKLKDDPTFSLLVVTEEKKKAIDKFLGDEPCSQEVR